MVPYKPLFHDGWSPGYVVTEDEEPPKPAVRRNPSQKSTGPGQQVVGAVMSDSGSDYGSDGSVYNVTKLSYRHSQGEAATRGQEEWRDLLMKVRQGESVVTLTQLGFTQQEMVIQKCNQLNILE